MGLERMTAVMQGHEKNRPLSNFDTDAFKPIIEQTLKVEPEKFGKNIDVSDLHLIADHIRAVTFAIADGVSPSNEKRGYVARKLIRRAYLKGGRKGPFLYNIVPTVVRIMKDVYPELEEKESTSVLL